MQATYAIYVRPAAEHFQVEQQNLVNADANYQGKRSILVIIQEPEPEAAIIMCLWSLLLGGSSGLQGHDGFAGCSIRI